MLDSKAALALASGVLLALSFPKYGHPAVAFIALVPLYVALSGWNGRPGQAPGVSTGQGFRLGLIAGFVHFAGTVYWTGATVQTFGGLPCRWRCSSPACWFSTWPPTSRWRRRPRPSSSVGSGWSAWRLSPAAWVATEYTRGFLFGGFPWIPLGNTMVTLLPIVQLASLVGVYGLSAFVALINAGFAVTAAGHRPHARRRRWPATLMLIAAASVWGGQRMAANRLTQGEPVRVGLIQGNIAQADKWNPARAGMIVDRYLQLTRQAVANGAEFLLWPESSTPFYFQDDPGGDVIRAMVRQLGKPLLLGSDEVERGLAESLLQLRVHARHRPARPRRSIARCTSCRSASTCRSSGRCSSSGRWSRRCRRSRPASA